MATSFAAALIVGFPLGNRLLGNGLSATIFLGIVLGILLTIPTHILNPRRRIVPGCLRGLPIALALLDSGRPTGIPGGIAAISAGGVGAMRQAKYLEYCVIASSACGGSVRCVLGAQLYLPLGASSAGRGTRFLLMRALSLRTFNGIVCMLDPRAAAAAFLHRGRRQSRPEARERTQ